MNKYEQTEIDVSDESNPTYPPPNNAHYPPENEKKNHHSLHTFLTIFPSNLATKKDVKLTTTYTVNILNLKLSKYADSMRALYH